MLRLQDGFTCMTSTEMLVREAEDGYAAQRGLVTIFLRSHWWVWQIWLATPPRFPEPKSRILSCCTYHATSSHEEDLWF